MDCPSCGEPLTPNASALAGGVTRTEPGAVLTCPTCGDQYVTDDHGKLSPYRWA